MDAKTIYQHNLAIVRQRWPDLALSLDDIEIDFERFELIQGNNPAIVCDNMQISSSYDSAAEAKLIASQLENVTSIAHVYGVGTGEVIDLIRSDISKVVVYVFNIMLFKVTLQVFDCRKWLTADNVSLELAVNFSYVKHPFVAIPAELMVSDENAAPLRDRVALELDSQYIAGQTAFDNPVIQQKIIANISNMQKDNDITHYPLAQDKLCVVAAAGPTLPLAFDWLIANRENITLIAVDAAVKPLFHNNIKPDLIVSIDQIGGELFREIAPTFYRDIPLLYFPLIDDQFISAWQGTRYASFSTGESFDVLTSKCDKTRLYSGGSVIHPSIDAAVKLGAKSVLLLGADFSFINEQRHAEFTQQFSHFNPLQPKDCKHWVVNGFGDKNPTYLNYRGYLRDLEQYIALHPEVTFYNGSKLGAKIAGVSLWPEFEDE